MSIGPAPRDEETAVREGGVAGRAGRGAPAGRGAQTAEAARATPTDLVSRVAGAQWGVIGSRQLIDCGVSTSTISRWVKSGRLHCRYPGVYTVGHAWLPVEGELMAALLAAGPGAALSHATAAWWWGLIEGRPETIEVSVPSRRHAPPAGLRFHHPRRLEPASHRRFPVTSVVQTLLDFAVRAALYETRRALAEAEFRGLVDLDEVRRALGRGRPGSATLRTALARHQPELAMTRNRFEAAFLELCESVGIPVPAFNTMVCGHRVDAVWREQRVVVELDGLQGHRTRAQLETDHARDLTLRQHGFEVRRYTWRQVTQKGAQVVADLPSNVRALAAP
ncbi:MAG TPA: type IV toxin-antitoxin system AbiEi family antitoxin domain-containing protein [Solirubrobacteraceae bacterium]|nr:type IV toxin-antitoxin system AbiEi family antitoxin domain-containing protein [Solirubrobacteraceae bacterium]